MLCTIYVYFVIIYLQLSAISVLYKLVLSAILKVQYFLLFLFILLMFCYLMKTVSSVFSVQRDRLAGQVQYSSSSVVVL